MLSFFRLPVLGDGLYRVLTSKISIRYFLGLSLETVSRHMTKLRQAGAIRLDPKGHQVFVEDLDMLERLAHLKR